MPQRLCQYIHQYAQDSNNTNMQREATERCARHSSRLGYYLLKKGFYLLTCGFSSSFDQQVVHCTICEHYENGTVHSQSDGINSKIFVVESEARENGSTRYFDIETILVVNEAEWRNFVDNEAFEAVVEDTQLYDKLASCLTSRSQNNDLPSATTARRDESYRDSAAGPRTVN